MISLKVHGYSLKKICYVGGCDVFPPHVFSSHIGESNRKAMNRNWSIQKENPALKTKTGNK